MLSRDNSPVVAIGTLGGSVTLVYANTVLATLTGVLTVAYLIVKLYYKIKRERRNNGTTRLVVDNDGDE